HTRFSRDWSSDVCSSDLVALGALGEDIEDQAGAVDHAHLQATLEVALLRRRERMIENDEFDLVIAYGVGDFLDLAGTDVQGGIRSEERRVGQGCGCRWSA